MFEDIIREMKDTDLSRKSSRLIFEDDFEGKRFCKTTVIRESQEFADAKVSEKMQSKSRKVMTKVVKPDTTLQEYPRDAKKRQVFARQEIQHHESHTQQLLI